MKTLVVRNRQRTRKVDTTALRKLTRTLLEDLIECSDYELGIRLVSADEMAKVNETFLQHSGSTDVITFDYSETEPNVLPASCRQSDYNSDLKRISLPSAPLPAECRQHNVLHGEIFISIDDALRQAKEFKTTWQSELTRYVVHGILHLEGYDDLKPALRKKMKREENRLVKELSRRFALSKLRGRTKRAR